VQVSGFRVFGEKQSPRNSISQGGASLNFVTCLSKSDFFPMPERNNNFNANSIDLISSKVTLERLNGGGGGGVRARGAEMGRQNITAPCIAYNQGEHN
jgi:hypothetical protein